MKLSLVGTLWNDAFSLHNNASPLPLFWYTRVRCTYLWRRTVSLIPLLLIKTNKLAVLNQIKHFELDSQTFDQLLCVPGERIVSSAAQFAWNFVEYSVIYARIVITAARASRVHRPWRQSPSRFVSDLAVAQIFQSFHARDQASTFGRD